MSDLLIFPADLIEQKTFAALRAAGADEPSAKAATRAMMHASSLGVDSHGVRLTGHYCKVLKGGRVNPKPNFKINRTAAASALLDADNGLGHAAAYAAMELACSMAREAGVGAVGIFASSHFGASGSYARAAAEAGCVGFSTTNSNPAVALHGGAGAFHGTNPLAFAAPVKGEKPWLFDMATSSIPFNRVYLYKTLGRALPEDVAANAKGEMTTDPKLVDMLIPLGGAAYGYKGAGLAGVATLFSALLTGANPDWRLPEMSETTDFSTPRNVGHFCMALDPDRFVGREAYDQLMALYLADLRGAPARPGETILAPGDREWKVEAERLQNGIPIDVETARFLELAIPRNHEA